MRFVGMSVSVQLALMALIGCGDDDGVRVCEPGRAVECVGAGGCSGGQVCNATGTGWGACECGFADASPSLVDAPQFDASDVDAAVADAPEADGAPADAPGADAAPLDAPRSPDALVAPPDACLPPDASLLPDANYLPDASLPPLVPDAVGVPDASEMVDARPPGALVAWWQFDEAAGSVLDSVGGHTGTVVGTITQGVAGRLGTGIELSDSGYVEVQHSPDLGLREYTVEAWVRTSSLEMQWIVVKNPTAEGFNDDYSMFLRHAPAPVPGSVGARVGGCSATATVDLHSSIVVADGDWHHVAASVDAGGTVTIFVDGGFQSAAAGSSPCLNEGPVLIGSWAGYGFVGRIDEVKIWSGARSEAEVCADAGGTPSDGTCVL